MAGPWNEDSTSSMRPMKIRTSTDTLPSEESYHISRWELGTANFEALAGVKACVDYIASIGGEGGVSSRRENIIRAWEIIGEHENKLKTSFLSEITKIDQIQLFGISDIKEIERRSCTFAIGVLADIEGGSTKLEDPDLLTSYLNKHGVACTYGNHYCTFWEKSLSLSQETGVVRISFLHYNTVEEVERIITLIKQYVDDSK